MNKIKALFQSRRFYVAVIAIIATVFQAKLGITEDAANQIAIVLIGWILGDSISKTQ